MHPTPHRTFRQRLAAGLRHGLILFLYLWTLFGLFVLNEQVVNREHGGHLIFQGFALLNALALAKVMMAAEHLELSGWLSDRPRIYAIVFEACFCTLLFMTVHMLERVLVGMARGEDLAADMPSFGGGGAVGAVIVGLIVFVSLLPFFTFKHVARAIGPERLRAILLARPLADADG